MYQWMHAFYNYQEKIPDLLKVMESALEEKMESCLKKEVETCLREKLQHCILEEMKTHFKLMEDNVVKRMEQMMKTSMDEKLEVRDSTSPINEQKKQVSQIGEPGHEIIDTVNICSEQ